MGSSSKQKNRDKDATGNDQGSSSNCRKRKHHNNSSATSEDRYDRGGASSADNSLSRDKKHKHRRHHRDKKRDKCDERQDYASSDSDVVEVVPQQYSAPETAGDGQSHTSLSVDQSNKMRAKLGLKPLQFGSVKHAKPTNTTQAQSAHDTLSISASDEIRAKLGLKPLQVGTVETASNRDTLGAGNDEYDDAKIQDDLGEFYHRPAGNMAADKKADKIKQRLNERKTKRAIENKLAKIKPLGTDDISADELDDSVAWVDRSRRCAAAKEAAAQRAAYLDALDEQFGVADVILQHDRKRKRAKAYGEKHLCGLRVEHDVGRFIDGDDGLGIEEKEVVLTLKDQGVLDKGDDVLVNVNMLDNERYEKSNLNKKRKLPHTFYTDEQLDAFGNPLPQSILSKYDEDIDGNKQTSDHFIIGHNTTIGFAKSTPSFNRNSTATIKEKLADSLLSSSLTIASEYYNEDEMAAFKKPKKIRKKMKRKGIVEVEGRVDIGDGGSLTRQLVKSENDKGIEGVGTRRPNRSGFDGRGRQFVAQIDGLTYDDIPVVGDISGLKIEDENDDHLERALTKARKLKLQERKEAVLKVEDILSLIKPETDDEPRNNAKDASLLPTTLSSSIILNSTAEFCRTLGDIPTYGRSGNRDDLTATSAQEDMATIDSYIKPDRRNSHGKHRMITMEIDSDDEHRDTQHTSYNDDDDDLQIMETDGRGQSRWSNVDGSTGCGNTAGVGGGVGGLGDKPILDEEPDVGAGVGAALKLAMSKGYLDKDETNRPSNTRLAHLQAKHYSIEDKAYGEGGEGERPGRRGGSAADRYSGPVQDFKEKDTFRPNVKLEYIDDDGHILNAKEAFRYLSHKFHGKGPGKNKVEKRIKKSQQEGLMKKMSSTDTPLGTLNMLQNKQKEMQSAFIVLSGGKHTHSTTTAISKSRR